VNAQAAYGTPAMLARDDIGSTVDIDQNNYLYVRVTNKGDADATGVNIRLYYSPASTLTDPAVWIPVNGATGQIVTGLTVPFGGTTVTAGVQWNPEVTPGDGGYPPPDPVTHRVHGCFIGVVDHTTNPAPDTSEIHSLDYTSFRNYIKNHNNVTWRNLNIVDVDAGSSPSPSPSPKPALPFKLYGAKNWILPKRMQLDVVAKLPRGAQIQLEVPYKLTRLMGSVPRVIGMKAVDFVKDVFTAKKSLEKDSLKGNEYIEKLKKTYIPLNREGNNLLEKFFVKKGAVHDMNLYVDIPEKFIGQKFRIYVRQLYDGQEIGRVTWLLAPVRRKPGEIAHGKKGKTAAARKGAKKAAVKKAVKKKKR
jgi:serine protease